MNAPFVKKAAVEAANFETTVKRGDAKHSVIDFTWQSPGAVGLRHYSRLFGRPVEDQAPKLYALIDHRQQSGLPRIVAQYVDPQAAVAAADQLRLAGATIEVVLLSETGL